MRSSTRLSSAVFQLTPTRTRCDLIIVANDKKEKIASGLLNPFLAHLKIAQDQVDKGGYSIILEPTPGTDSSWFTKATLERFVRFVSTPEILERVYTIETEILQIEEAIAIQSSNDIGQSIVENHQRKSLGGYEGDKSVTSANEEKAIVLYTQPETPLPDANGSEGGNSRAQLLKVLETRRTALQKEQGMAFARAVAAGFDIDDISPLVSFAECFGAMRLLEACTKFINLWKRKHETGQWLDIDASESLVAQSDFSTINASGIILSTTPNNHDDSNNDPASVNTGKPGSTSNTENPFLNGQQEYIQGQFPQFLFPPWPMHAPPGAQPVFQAYPVQGMPYYPAYAGNGHLFQPPQHAMEHSPPNFDPQSGMRQPLDVMGGSTGQETIENNRTRSLDDTMLNAEVSHGRKSRKDSGGSNKKQSGMVVIRNINYITSNEKKSHSDTNSDSCSDVDTVHDSNSDDQEVIHHNKKRSSKRGGNHPQSADKLGLSNDEAAVFGISGDNRQWQAFQDCLLKGSDEGVRADNKGLFAMEKSGKIKKLAAGDDPLSSSVDNDSRSYGHMDVQVSETGRRKILSRSTHEDFMIGNRQKQGDLSDSLAVNSFEGATSKIGRDASQRMSDETLVVPFRSMSIGQGTDGTAIDIDSEIPSKYQKLESRGNNKVNYEPNDLSLMPERRNDKRPTGYDLTLDYEMQGYAEGSQGKGKKSVIHVKGGVKKTERDRRSKMTPDSLHKQKTGGLVRKSYPSKMSASEDARARAERLRSYKAELQKMKKEKEDEEQKRLEALKLARQKRIAARGSPAVKQSTPSPQTKQSLPKLSPATSRGSKFSDLGPGSSSPLQRSKIRTSLVSSEPPKASKASTVKEVTRTSGHRLTRSSSSLSETKREKNSGSDSKASISRIRRLSEPKTITNPLVTTTKLRSMDGVLKRKLFHGPEKNKVSAIIDLDRSKAATLPELKIKTTKSSNSRSAGEDRHKTTGARPSEVPKHAEQHTNSSHTVHQTDVEENPIVEKSVVVLESEKPTFPVSYSSEAKSEVWNQQQNNRPKGEKDGMTSESACMPVPPLMNKESMSSKLRKQSDFTEVRASHSERDPSNFGNITKDGKSYQVLHTRVSSLGDHTQQSNYGKVPLVRTEQLSRAEDKVRMHVPDVKAPHLDKHQLLSEKSSKDSPKGFRRLLKFGKKSHTSSSMDQSFESDCTTGDGIEHGDSAKKASTSQAHTLKNLISHDDDSAASNVGTKSSRPFSLLSPFWSKSSEKKQAS